MARGVNGPRGQALALLTAAMAAGWGTAAAADAPDAYWNTPWVQVSGAQPELAGAVNNGLRRANETYFYGERATKMLATIRGDVVDLKIVDQATGEVLAERRGIPIGGTDSSVTETIAAGTLAWMDTLNCDGGCAAAGGSGTAATRVATAPEAAEAPAEPVKAPPAMPEPARETPIEGSDETAVPRTDDRPRAAEVALAPVEAPKTTALALAEAPATDDAPDAAPAGAAPDLALANVPVPRARIRLDEPAAASVGKLAGISLEGVMPATGAPDAAPEPAIADLPAAAAPEPAAEPIRIAALPEKDADLPTRAVGIREGDAPVQREEEAPAATVREPEAVETPVVRAEPEVVETPLVRDDPAAPETPVLRSDPVIAAAPATRTEPEAASALVAPAEPAPAASDNEAPADAEPVVAAAAPAGTLRDVTPGVALPLPRPEQVVTVPGEGAVAPVLPGSGDTAAPSVPEAPESPPAVPTIAEDAPDTKVAAADATAAAPTFEPKDAEAEKDARLAAELDASLPGKGEAEVVAAMPEAAGVSETPLKAPGTAVEAAPADPTNSDATPPADKVETRVAAVDPTGDGPTLANARWIGFTPAVYTGSDQRAGAWISGPFDRKERTGWITDTATGATTRVTFVWRAADGGNRTAQLSREAAKALGLGQGDVANVAVYLPR